MQVQFSKMNIRLIHVSGNKCMEIVKKTDAWLQKEEEEAQQWRLGEVEARKLLKKGDSERNRCNQMAGEEKARNCRRREMLRETYRQLTDEEKARILQNNRNAERNEYKQMTVEDKVRILQKQRCEKKLTGSNGRSGEGRDLSRGKEMLIQTNAANNM